MLDVNWIYCGDHFSIHTNMESCCTPEITLILYAYYTLKKFLLENLGPLSHLCGRVETLLL